MPNRMVYVSEDDIPLWDEAQKIAKTHNTSLSKVIMGELKQMVRERRAGAGVPLGFAVPTSMKDPKLVRAEALADTVRQQVLDALLSEDES